MSTTQENEWSGPIWPTRVTESVVSSAKGRSTSAYDVQWDTPRAVLDAISQRTRGIAEGHVRARRRMRRFVAWLGAVDTVAGVALSHYLSPEQAVMASPAIRRLVFSAMGGTWMSRSWGYSDSRVVAEDMMGVERCRDRGPSHEWAALPWQREPAERICGGCKKPKHVCDDRFCGLDGALS